MKKWFPLSFTWSKSLISMLIGVLVYLVVGAVAGFAIGILNSLPLFGLIAWILGLIVEAYVIAGIIILVLAYLKIVK